VIAPLARVAEVRALQRTAQNLLDTYIGNQAGERIMAGKIRRGDVEAIRAAMSCRIWRLQLSSPRRRKSCVPLPRLPRQRASTAAPSCARSSRARFPGSGTPRARGR
jgi:hypothetical protein